MRNHIFAGYLSLLVAASLRADPPADASVIEAESQPGSGAVESDPTASGGAFSQHGSAWKPLFEHSVAHAQSPMEIWVRHRGLPVQLKCRTPEGSQVEKKWIYERPAEWKWNSAGILSAEELRHGFLFIRGKDGDEGTKGGIDAVALAPAAEPSTSEATEENAVFQPATKGEGSSEKPALITITASWDAEGRPISERAWSVAGFSAFNPEIAGDEKYHAGMRYLAPGIVRYHNTSMLKDSERTGAGWLDHETHQWDAQKIDAALDAWEPKGVEKVICIPNWPPWMDEDGDHYLDAGRVDDFADFCAALVRIVNVEQGHAVKYFEITNERDGLYWLNPPKKGMPKRIAELAAIFNAAAAKIKAVDPSVKTGGPAATRPDMTEDLREFVRLTKPQLDFLSYHAYASGKASESDASIYDKTAAMGEHNRALRQMLDEASPEKRIETHFNEWNISWTWKTREPRMVNYKGAVFDALVLAQLAEAGTDVGNAWNERDNIYGKMGADYALRPSAHVFHLFNDHLQGSVLPSHSDHPRLVTPLIVRHEGGLAFALVNRSGEEQTVKLDGLPPAVDWAGARVSAEGYEPALPAPASFDAAELPPQSVSVFWRASSLP